MEMTTRWYCGRREPQWPSNLMIRSESGVHVEGMDMECWRYFPLWARAPETSELQEKPPAPKVGLVIVRWLGCVQGLTAIISPRLPVVFGLPNVCSFIWTTLQRPRTYKSEPEAVGLCFCILGMSFHWSPGYPHPAPLCK